MTTLVNTLVSVALGLGMLLGLWLLLVAGSVVLWEAMRRWSTAPIEVREHSAAVLSPPRID
jgi:hypothetical protein